VTIEQPPYAGEFPFEHHAVSVTPKGKRTPVVYRYRTAEALAAAWPGWIPGAPPPASAERHAWERKRNAAMNPADRDYWNDGMRFVELRDGKLTPEERETMATVLLTEPQPNPNRILELARDSTLSIRGRFEAMVDALVATRFIQLLFTEVLDDTAVMVALDACEERGLFRQDCELFIRSWRWDPGAGRPRLEATRNEFGAIFPALRRKR
jgi:hypothetical protein